MQVALLLCLSGCAVIPPYPGALPDLAPSNTNAGAIPEIGGQYADNGQGFSPGGEALGEASLTGLLKPRAPDGSPLANADIVVVTGPTDGVLKLQFFQGDQLVATLQRREADISAGQGAEPDTYLGNKGFVCLGLGSTSAGAAGIGLMVSQEDLWLRKAVDGSLIVLHRDMGAGVFIVVPIWGRHDAWFRFPPVAGL